jgi:hypothetical protein
MFSGNLSSTLRFVRCLLLHTSSIISIVFYSSSLLYILLHPFTPSPLSFSFIFLSPKGETPTPESLAAYCALFGRDFFGFWYGGLRCLVVNSPLLRHPEVCTVHTQSSDGFRLYLFLFSSVFSVFISISLSIYLSISFSLTLLLHPVIPSTSSPPLKLLSPLTYPRAPP